MIAWLRRRALAAGAILVLLGALTGMGVRFMVGRGPCQVPLGRVPNWHELSCHSESALHYPASTYLFTGGIDEEDRTFEGPTSAEYMTSWASPGTATTEIDAWFERQLARRGWSQDGYFAIDNDYSTQRRWQRGSREFISVIVYTDPRRHAPSFQGPGPVYEVRFGIAPATFPWTLVPG